MIKGMDEVIEFIEQQGEEKKELKKEIEKLGEIIFGWERRLRI